MIAIDLAQEDRELGDDLALLDPDGIMVVDGRAIDGTLTHLTVFVTAAAMALSEVRRIVLELIRSKRHRSVTIKGVKLQGYSDKEVKYILAEINRTPGED